MPKIDLSQYDGNIVVGMFLDTPPPGSVDDFCEACDRAIIIGPDSLRVMKENPTIMFVKACMPCAIRYAASKDVTPNVYRAKDAL